MTRRLAPRGSDFHETPAVATLALIKAEVEYMPQYLWEPACGAGAIVRVLRDFAYTVAASDLVARPEGQPMITADFLKFARPPFSSTGRRGIVTNPPYGLADAFVKQALALSDYVAMLLPLAYLEGIERRGWLPDSPLARVYVFSYRVPMMHRVGYDGPKARNTRAFAWFVWDIRRQQGEEPVIRWL